MRDTAEVRLPQQRRAREVSLMRDRMEELLARAKIGETVDHGTSGPFWNDFLAPLLRAQVSGFTDPGVIMQLDPKDFPLHQFAAQKFQALLDRVDALRGIAAECKREAEALLRTIEQAEAEGLVERQEAIG